MSDYYRQLEKELDWRISEISALKRIIPIDKSTTEYRVVLRSLVVLLYAHYEGFCRYLWQFYLIHIEKMKLRRIRLKDKLAALSMEKELKKAKNTYSTNQLYNYCRTEFRDELSIEAKFRKELDNNLNFWPAVLKEELDKIDIPSEEIINCKYQINFLVRLRNKVAHGEKLTGVKDIDDFTVFQDAVMRVLSEFIELVCNFLEKQEYLKR